MSAPESVQGTVPPVPGLAPAVAARHGEILDAIDQGFCVIQVVEDVRGRPVDYRFLEINALFEAQTGLEDALGRSMRELRPDHEEHWFEIYGEIARTGRPLRFERPAAALGRWYSVYAFRVGDPEERLVAVLFSDITERKVAELERDEMAQRLAADLEAMRRLNQLSARLVVTEALGDMLDEILDAVLKIQGADRGNIQLYDDSTGSLRIAVHRGFLPEFLEHFRVVDASDDSACGRALRSGERVLLEDVRTDPAFAPHLEVAERAGYRAVQSTPMLAHDGRPLGMLSTHFRWPHRPTERELHLTDLYLHVASEMLGRLRQEQELREAKEAAERANAAKTNFLSTMSHELRTPLNGIVGFSDLLRSEITGPLNAHQKKQLDRIQANSHHLIGIIDEILTFARAEAGQEQVRTEEVDLEALGRSVLGMLESQAHGLELRLSAREPVRVHTDPVKVRQIVTNLVGNALRYTVRGRVELELVGRADRAEVRVRDTGSGIAADRLEEIFEPFVQLDPSRTRERGGAGLGLAICRRLARLLGGDVTVRSEPGRGSEFTLTLPRTEEGEATPR